MVYDCNLVVPHNLLLPPGIVSGEEIAVLRESQRHRIRDMSGKRRLGTSLRLSVHVGGGAIVVGGLTRGLLVRHGDLD